MPRSEDKLKIVVLMHDGRRHKGLTDRFDPEKPFLLLCQVDHLGKQTGFVDVEMKQVRAAFFVRDLAINRTSRHTVHDAPFQPPPPDPARGTLVRTMFAWGEIMDAVIYDYDPDAPYYFLHPHGPLNRAYNLDRVFLRRDAVREIKVLATMVSKARD